MYYRIAGRTRDDGRALLLALSGERGTGECNARCVAAATVTAGGDGGGSGGGGGGGYAAAAAAESNGEGRVQRSAAQTSESRGGRGGGRSQPLAWAGLGVGWRWLLPAARVRRRASSLRGSRAPGRWLRAATVDLTLGAAAGARSHLRFAAKQFQSFSC